MVGETEVGEVMDIMGDNKILISFTDLLFDAPSYYLLFKNTPKTFHLKNLMYIIILWIVFNTMKI